MSFQSLNLQVHDVAVPMFSWCCGYAALAPPTSCSKVSGTCICATLAYQCCACAKEGCICWEGKVRSVLA